MGKGTDAGAIPRLARPSRECLENGLAIEGMDIVPALCCSYSIRMQITYDPAKRQKTLTERGLDFEEAPLVFSGEHFTREDDRKEYGEVRFLTVGRLRGRLVVLVWTPRGGDTRHIISMRKANEREQSYYTQYLG